MSKILVEAGPSERGWHRFEQASRCLRLFALNQSGHVPRTMSDPLVKGSLLHVGLAQYYAAKMNDGLDYYSPEEGIKILSEQMADESVTAHDAALWRIHVPEIIQAVKAYIVRWRDCPWEVVAVEKELRAQIPRLSGDGTFLFTQRADLIVKDHHDIHWIVDHKSCYRIDSKTLRQHILSGQFLGYQIFGRKMYGKKFGGVIVNRVMLRGPYGFDRCTLEPAPHAVKRFIHNLAHVEDSTERYEGKEPFEWPAAYSDQVCWGKYGKCRAFELCQWGQP